MNAASGLLGSAPGRIGAPVTPEAEARFRDLAHAMFRRFPGHTTFSRAFLHPSNLWRLLLDLEHGVKVRRYSQAPRMDWDFVYERLVRPFAAMPRDASDRQFATLADANLLFWNQMVEPWLLYDARAWHFKYELLDKRYKGIDYNQLRRYARDPSALGYGLPRQNTKATRGVGTNHPETSYYHLSHPWSDGRDRQRRALAAQGLGPLPLPPARAYPGVPSCAYGPRAAAPAP